MQECSLSVLWGSTYILSRHREPSQVSVFSKHHIPSHKTVSKKTSLDITELLKETRNFHLSPQHLGAQQTSPPVLSGPLVASSLWDSASCSSGWVLQMESQEYQRNTGEREQDSQCPGPCFSVTLDWLLLNRLVLCGGLLSTDLFLALALPFCCCCFSHYLHHSMACV